MVQRDQGTVPLSRSWQMAERKGGQKLGAFQRAVLLSGPMGM